MYKTVLVKSLVEETISNQKDLSLMGDLNARKTKNIQQIMLYRILAKNIKRKGQLKMLLTIFWWWLFTNTETAKPIWPLQNLVDLLLINNKPGPTLNRRPKG